MVARGRQRQAKGTAHPSLPAVVRARGPALFDQQCWLWGCDIRRNDGNLLLDYGFARVRPPETSKGSNRYDLALGATGCIALWAFGPWYGEAALGGLLLNRYHCVPCLALRHEPPRTMWQPQDARELKVPQQPDQWQRALDLLAALSDWIAGYERWVIANAGLAYREACVAARSHGLYRIAPTQALSEWQELAQACRASAR
jgi:hypothetical protein